MFDPLNNLWRTATIGLAVALAFTIWRADQISEARERLRDDLAAEAAAHSITRSSVARLELEIARQNDAVRTLQEERVSATRNAEKALREAQRANERLSSDIDRIRARKPTGCDTGKEIRDAEI